MHCDNVHSVNDQTAFTQIECDLLTEACRKLPPAKGDYRVYDYVENLLLTVIDFQMRTIAVERAMGHFIQQAKREASDISGLKTILKEYPDDKVGNMALARRLWGYNFWTRAEMLRKLVAFFEAQGITDQTGLETWASRAQFATDFQGKVKGLGFAVFKWLTVRLGADTVKPDVHVMRFVNEAIGRPVSEVAAVEILERAAKRAGIPAYKVDWAIWEHQRKLP